MTVRAAALPCRLGLMLAAVCCAASLAGLDARAQPPFPLPPGQAAVSPRESAAIDVTGYWVAIVNEDWRWRMVTPPKGDYASIPLNPQGRAVADTWEPSMDGSCKAYGAAGLLRMPTRLKIDWQSDDVLTIATDAGRQTRYLHFGRGEPEAEHSRQGYSAAEWVRTLPPAGRFIGFGGGGPPAPGGSLQVVTTRLLPGWLRRNGVPYSENAVVTEYFDRFPSPNGDEWLMVTTIVEDPEYLTMRYITSSHFKREGGGAKWKPTACDER